MLLKVMALKEKWINVLRILTFAFDMMMTSYENIYRGSLKKKKMKKYLLENFTLLENLAQMWKI